MYPRTLDELRTAIARETARMSWPGGMFMGPNPIFTQGAKEATERFFTGRFIATLWRRLPPKYDDWHKKETKALAGRLALYFRNPDNKQRAVARKLIDTFMHQLMNYERFRPMWCDLHLPLDNKKVFHAFRHNIILPESHAVSLINERITQKSAYKIDYSDYRFIQDRLSELVDELNQRRGRQFQLASRIELNLMWANDDH